MRSLFITPLVIFVVVLVFWVLNLVKLTECDFQANYRCEAIHAIGIIPPAALVTVWFDTDKQP